VQAVQQLRNRLRKDGRARLARFRRTRQACAELFLRL
jgi:hypothetical protein